MGITVSLTQGARKLAGPAKSSKPRLSTADVRPEAHNIRDSGDLKKGTRSEAQLATANAGAMAGSRTQQQRYLDRASYSKYQNEIPCAAPILIDPRSYGGNHAYHAYQRRYDELNKEGAATKFQSLRKDKQLLYMGPNPVKLLKEAGDSRPRLQKAAGRASTAGLNR